jgi:murein DD-endopeptidase MepM/ murein hydrolase activator NlpD
MYRLPFWKRKKGKKEKLKPWQLSNGNHDDPISGHTMGQYYAFDFNHAVGARVLAARGGFVVITENNVNINTIRLPEGHPDIQKYGAGTYVLIRHIDGTVAAYDHLKKGSILVKKDK